MKKKVIISLIVLLILGAGGFFGIRAYRKHKMNANPVKVFPVSMISGYGWDSDESTYDGNVVVNHQQNVVVPQNSVIEELHVQEGMLVHPGDVLLTYDMTSENLALEMMQAQLSKYQADLTIAQHELAKLKNTVPLEDLPAPEPEPEPEPEPDASPTDAPSEEPQGEPGEGVQDPEAGEGEDPEEELPPTRKELEEAIRDKQRSINDASYQVKMQELNILKKERSLKQGEVRATITGIVQKADISDEVIASGEAAIVVTAQNAVTVKIYVNELDLAKMQLGDPASVYSWEHSYNYYGQITEIGQEPANDYYGYSEYTASWYPVTISLSDDDPDAPELMSGEWLSASISASASFDGESETRTLPLFMVMEEEGVSYVLKEEKGRLVKQVINTGKVYWGSEVEILGGISQSDYIAFPYASDAVEGKACVESENFDDLYN